MLVTTETFQQYLWNSLEEEHLLEPILKRAQAIAEKIIGRRIEEKSYVDEEMDGHGEVIFPLASYPVTEFTKFQYKNGDTWEDVTDEYHLKKATGEIRLPYSCIPRGFWNVRVSYKGGYTSTTVPQEIAQAILDIGASIVNKRGSEGITREKIDGAELEFSQDGAVPESTRTILESYRAYNV